MSSVADPRPSDPHASGAWTPERQRQLNRDALRGLVVSVALIAAAFAAFVVYRVLTSGHGPHHWDVIARAVLRPLPDCQSQFAAACWVDTDGDGIGEFGTFRELAGGVAVRAHADGRNDESRVCQPPILRNRFRAPDALGRVRIHGYLFRMILPGPDGAAVREDPSATERTVRDPVDADAAEMTWCAYAWPARYGTSGERSFFISSSGGLLTTDDPLYSGDSGPPPGAALTTGGLNAITGAPAVDTAGQDGNVWERIE